MLWALHIFRPYPTTVPTRVPLSPVRRQLSSGKLLSFSIDRYRSPGASWHYSHGNFEASQDRWRDKIAILAALTLITIVFENIESHRVQADDCIPRRAFRACSRLAPRLRSRKKKIWSVSTYYPTSMATLYLLYGDRCVLTTDELQVWKASSPSTMGSMVR